MAKPSKPVLRTDSIYDDYHNEYHNVHLLWDNVVSDVGIARWEIYIDDVKGFETRDANILSTYITNLPCGKSAKYNLVAIDNNGRSSDPSNSIIVSTKNVLAPPEKPRVQIIQYHGILKIEINIMVPTTDTISIYRDGAFVAKFNLFTIMDYYDRGLATGLTYQYAIVASNKMGSAQPVIIKIMNTDIYSVSYTGGSL